jgi:hypothetical protein
MDEPTGTIVEKHPAVRKATIVMGGLLAALTFMHLPTPSNADTAKPKNEPVQDKVKTSPKPTIKLGLVLNDPRALPGYTLIAPLRSTMTYLIDTQGKVVHEWHSRYTPAASVYLLENGHLLRTCDLGLETRSFGGGAAPGGRVQEYGWNGELVWDFKFFNPKQLPHHDVTRLPNGNLLMIVWDKKTAKEAIAAGRRPELVGNSHLLPDSLIEVRPTGKTTGQVVWEWHLWDHLVQDFDKSKPNYGNVAEHPELVNINYGEEVTAPVVAAKVGAAKRQSTAKAAPATTPPRPRRANPDWTHANCVAYNAELDQVVVSVHEFSEIWVIDHGTTTAEAAGHTGGRRGKGGDLLYRWGNPRAYRGGTKADQRLFAQHNAHWIPRGLPGAGHLLVFNNGPGRPGGTYSSVDEIVLPVDAEGRYVHKPGTAYGPDTPLWRYTAPKTSDFFSHYISGAQRLPNGHTLICSGANGTVFEVTPAKDMVWKYVNPCKARPAPDVLGLANFFQGLFSGASRNNAPPPRVGVAVPSGRSSQRSVQILPGFLQDALKLTAKQKEQVARFEKDASAKLDKILTEGQRKQLKDMRGSGGPGLPGPGQVMTPLQQARLKATADQTKQIAEIQKEADGKLAAVLSDEQKQRLKRLPAGVVPSGPGGPTNAGPPGGIPLFRAYRYGPTYPGVAGKKLTPGKTIEELERQDEPKKKVAPQRST